MTQAHVPYVPDPTDPTDLLRGAGGMFPFLCGSAREKDEEPFLVDPSAFLFPFSGSSGNLTGKCVLTQLCPPKNFFCTPAPLWDRA